MIDVPRRCGSCAGCCTFPPILELEKPAGVTCRNSKASGCSIYETRPQACRDYSCLWLDGEFDIEDRPDAVGLAFDLPSRVQDHSDYEGIHAICARETHPGSSQSPRAQALLQRLARSMVVRLYRLDAKTQLLGPQALVELLVTRAKARDTPGV